MLVLNTQEGKEKDICGWMITILPTAVPVSVGGVERDCCETGSTSSGIRIGGGC